jgi:hypothetical protein
MTPDRQQQLVLRGGQAGRPGLLLAPAQESTQTGPQLEQVREVSLIERHVG